jgi:hypothetical protein
MESGGMSKLEIKYVSTDSLRPYAGNARTHSKKQIRQIADSIERFGFEAGQENISSQIYRA